MPKVAQTQAPGDVLKALMDEYDLNPFKLSKEINLSPSGVRQVVIGKTKVSVSVALRLAKYFNTTPNYWLDLQRDYDLYEAAQDHELTGVLTGIEKAKKPAPPPKGAKAQGEKQPAAKQEAPAPAEKRKKAAPEAKPAARTSKSKRES